MAKSEVPQKFETPVKEANPDFAKRERVQAAYETTRRSSRNRQYFANHGRRRCRAESLRLLKNKLLVPTKAPSRLLSKNRLRWKLNESFTYKEVVRKALPAKSILIGMRMPISRVKRNSLFLTASAGRPENQVVILLPRQPVIMLQKISG